MSDYVTADYEASQRAVFLDLMRAAWGESSMSGEEFDWWFERNPSGKRLIAVALEDGEALGVAGTSCFPMLIDGQERIGTFSVHATTRADARGRGIFARLELHNEARSRELGAACVLAFASKPTVPIFLRRLGWHDVGRLRVWARLLRPGAALRRPSDRPSRPAEELGRASEGARRYGKLVVVPLTRFGPATDAIYQRVATSWGNHVVRSAAHMNWRYLESPWGYRAFAAIEAGETTGYTVVRLKSHRGTPLGVIADFVAQGDSYAVTRVLLRRALSELKGHADAVIALPPNGRAQHRAFLSLGFAPVPMGLRFMGASLDDRFEFPTRRSAWHFSLGDSDFF